MKHIVLASTLAFTLSSSLYAGGGFKDVEPVIDTPLIEVIEHRNYNVALKAGTLGIGVDVSTPITEELAVRFNVNGFQYSRTEEIDDISYDGDLNLFTAGLLLDYYPTQTAFRVSAGAYYNNNNFTGLAKPTASRTIEINGIEYSDADVGQLDSDITFNKIAPYLGVGWGNDARTEGWGFTFDLGVMYHGEPKSDLEVTINNTDVNDIQEIRDAVEAEKNSLQSDISAYKFYPVVMMGVNYTF